MSVSLGRFLHLLSLIHFQPSGNFRHSMQICTCLAWLIKGWSCNRALSRAVSVFKYKCKILWRLSCHWEMLTLPLRLVFCNHIALFCIAIHVSWMCITGKAQPHADGGWLTSASSLCALIAYWPPVCVLLLWWDALYIPESNVKLFLI